MLYGILIGVVSTLVVMALYFAVAHRLMAHDIGSTEESLLQRAAILLHQIRVMAAANIVAFVVLGTLAIISLTRLSESNNNFAKVNRITICDLYEKTNNPPPKALRCGSDF